MLLRDLLAYIVQPQLVVDLLEEQVASIVTALLAFGNHRGWRVLHDYFLVRLFLCCSQFRNVPLCSADRIFFAKTGSKLFDCSQSFIVLCRGTTILLTVGLLDVVDWLLA